MLALLAAGLGRAQQTEELQVSRGSFGTMVTGSITGQVSADDTLAASARQERGAEITVAEIDGNGTVYFNGPPPGSDGKAIWIGSMDADNSGTAPLRADAGYMIRVYLKGNDEDADKTARHNLDLSTR